MHNFHSKPEMCPEVLRVTQLNRSLENKDVQKRVGENLECWFSKVWTESFSW